MRTIAKVKDTLPWVKDGFPIRVIRRKKTQDGVKNYWDKARVVEEDGTKYWEFKRTDGSGVIRMEKEQSNLLGELEYFDREYVIDRRKAFMEVFQNSEQDFYVLDFSLEDAEDENGKEINSELAQNRNLYHQSVEQIAEDAVEISNPQDNKVLLGIGLLGIMIGSAVVNYLVISGAAEQIAKEVGKAVAKNMPQNAGEAAGAAGTVAFMTRQKLENLKNRFI